MYTTILKKAIGHIKITIPLIFILNTLSGVSQSIGINAGYDLNLTCLDEAQLNARIINWRKKQSWEHGIKSVCFADKNTLFAVGGEWDQGMILKSIDGGHFWVELSAPPAYNFINKVFFLNSDTGFIVGGRIENLIMKTLDGGYSWSPYFFGYYNALNSVCFANDRVGFAVGPDVFMKTTDCGANWLQLTMPHHHFSDITFMDSLTGFAVGYGMYLTDESGKMMKTTDGGLTWSEVNLNFNFKLTSVTTSGNTIYVTSSHGMVLVSHNKFDTWEIMQTGTLADLNHIAFRDAKHGIVVGSKGTILTTENGGINWTKEYADYNSPQYAQPEYTDGEGSFTDIVFIDDSIGMAAGVPLGDGTLDSGSFVLQIPLPENLSFQWLPTDYLTNPHIPNPLVSAVQTTEYSVSVSGSDQLIASDQLTVNIRNPYVWAGQDTILASSKPYEMFGIAETGCWQTKNREIFGKFDQVQFFTPDTGIAIYQGDLVKTTDAGNTFVNLATHHHLMFTSFHFLDHRRGFAAGAAGLIMKTTDAGLSWTDISIETDEHFESIYFVDTLTGYCCGTDGTIVKTSDGGTSWSTYILPESETLSKIYFVSPERGFVVGNIFNHSYAFTTNGGLSWEKSEYVLNSYIYNDICFVDDSVGFILGTMLGPLIVQSTTDGGRTWQKKLFVRYDIGSTTYKTIFFTDRYNGYIGDYAGEIIRTWDGGKTWYITEKMPAWIYDLYFINANDGYMGAGVLRHFHASSDITFEWAPAQSVSDPTSSHTYANPSEPTTYQFIASKQGNCALADEVKVSPYGYGVETFYECSVPYLVYPNPAKDILIISSAKGNKPAFRVSLFTARGDLALEDANLSTADRKYQLEPKFSPGLYFVEITDAEGTFRYKIIVQ